MSNQRQREDFIARLAKHNIPPDDARKLLRYARTLHRLAEAQCNGDWPADNGQRPVEACAECKGLWAPSVLLKGKRCPKCRTTAHVRALCAEITQQLYPDRWVEGEELPKLTPEFSGDPRGCVLKLRIPGDPGGIDGFVGVP